MDPCYFRRRTWTASLERIVVAVVVVVGSLHRAHAFVVHIQRAPPPRQSTFSSSPRPVTPPMAFKQVNARSKVIPPRSVSRSTLHRLLMVLSLDDATVPLLLTTAVQSLPMTSPEPIHSAFAVITFLPQPFWLLLILLPNSQITKTVMGGLQVPILCCLVHFLIVVASLGQEGATAPLTEFADVFDPSGDPQAAFLGMTSNYPNFVAEEWSHVLAWDLFVGRWIWKDGLRRRIFTGHSVLLCNLIGPPGLLAHVVTCLAFGDRGDVFGDVDDD